MLAVTLLVIALLAVALLAVALLAVAWLAVAGRPVIVVRCLLAGEARLIVSTRPGRSTSVGRVECGVRPAGSLVIAGRCLRPGANGVVRPGTDRAPGHRQAGLRSRAGGERSLRAGAERGLGSGLERVARVDAIARLIAGALAVTHDRRGAGSRLVAGLLPVAGLRPVPPVLAVAGLGTVTRLLGVPGILAVPGRLPVAGVLTVRRLLAVARFCPVRGLRTVGSPLAGAGSQNVAAPLTVAGGLVVILRLVVAGQASSAGAKDALIAADGAVAAGRLALLIALIVRSGAFGFGTGVPAPRGGVPTTHLCSIPRRGERRLVGSARDAGVAGTAPG